MRITTILAAAAATVMVACGGGSGGEGGVNTTALTSCDPTTERVGTYLVHYQTDSGTCGDISDALVVLNTATAGSSACTVITTTWSDGNCRNDTELRCPVPGAGLVTTTDYTVQQAQDGSRLTGRVTLRATACTGTYDVTYTRQ